MPNLEPKDWVAIYAAGLSTILAVVKFVELWNTRIKINIAFDFTSSVHVGNRIYIRNLSSRPVIVGHWDVLLCTGYWPFRKFEGIIQSDHDEGDHKIDSNSTLKLEFKGASYFKGHVVASGKRIFIRLWIAGQSPRYYLVYKGEG